MPLPLPLHERDATMRIYNQSLYILCFDDGDNGGTEWVRFTASGGRLIIDSSGSPVLSERNIKTLRKWLKKAFRKPIDISKV